MKSIQTAKVHAAIVWPVSNRFIDLRFKIFHYDFCFVLFPGAAHPRLARGESYTCGYKPYRCEICNYSTTTKGNLSIHMQSDKHLNNVQELSSTQNLVRIESGYQVNKKYSYLVRSFFLIFCDFLIFLINNCNLVQLIILIEI